MNDNEIILFEGMKFQECEEEIKDESIIQDALKEVFFIQLNETSRLRFVGLIKGDVGGKAYTIYSFPKYLRNARNINKECMREILKIIEKTNHTNDFQILGLFDENAYKNQKRKASRVDLAKWLVDDYCRYGIFCFRKKKNTFEKKGKVNWSRTIQKTYPVHISDDIVYTQLVYSYTDRLYDNEIAEIQRCVIAEAIEFIKYFEDINVSIPEYNVFLKGNLDKHVNIIRKYQRTVFTNRDVALLRALEAWCEGETKYYNIPFIGTVSFELVWEDVLRSVFGHDKLSRSEGFGAPIYSIFQRDYTLAGDSIPDVMNFWNDNEKIMFLIIDGKYYLGKAEKNKVRDLPGYKDISKQIDYFATLKKIYNLPPDNGKNIFVLPWWDISSNENVSENTSSELHSSGIKVRYLGFARKPGAKDPLKSIIDSLMVNTICKSVREETSDYVHLVQISPDTLYKIYLEGVIDTQVNAREMWDYVDKAELLGWASYEQDD